MTDICQGWNSTDTAYKPNEQTTRYYIDATNVQQTNGPVVYRQERSGTNTRLWAWSKTAQKWVPRKAGPDKVWRQSTTAEAAWLNAPRGVHVSASNARSPKEERRG